MKVDADHFSFPKAGQGAVRKETPDVTLRTMSLRRRGPRSAPQTAGIHPIPFGKEMALASEAGCNSVMPGETTGAGIPTGNELKAYDSDTKGARGLHAPAPWHYRIHFFLFPICCVVILLAAFLFMIVDLVVFVVSRRLGFRKLWNRIMPSPRCAGRSHGAPTA